MYERFALIYDSPAGQLGQAALGLLDRGIDVLYAADLDEALLLATQEEERLGALLVPSSLEPGSLAELIHRLAPRLPSGIETMVPVGLEPEPDVAALLRRAGVRWCLWEPCELRELRFVAAAALMAGNPGERRKALRVPTRVAAEVLQGNARRSGVLCDLSQGGAYLGVDPPFATGSEVQMEFEVAAASIFLRGRVVHAHTPERPPRNDLPGGIGVEFLEVPERDRTALGQLISELTQPYRL